MTNIRTVAAKALYSVAEEGQSLATLRPQFESGLSSQDQALLNEIVFGCCRWFFYLEKLLQPLLKKPIKKKDKIAHYLLIVGLYQLRFTRVPQHAAINETVAAAEPLAINHLRGLINAILREFGRSTSIDANDTAPTEANFSHPDWLFYKLKANWPAYYQDILAANNVKAPLTIRVNRTKVSREDYLKQLVEAGIKAQATEFAEFGITLDKPMDVTAMPGYTQGLFSVQDEAAQLCTTLLDIQPNQTILDACAAPGGKTTGIIEAASGKVKLTALDSDQKRLGRVHENLERLQQTATIQCADASRPDSWWDSNQYDRILVDAPCSATGVIRRHPDIKLLRKETDITPLAKGQLAILEALWPLLKPGGKLVYATCSIFPQENTRIIEQFIKHQHDAADSIIEAEWGIPCTYGRQLFPVINGNDGFYYACLVKQA